VVSEGVWTSATTTPAPRAWTVPAQAVELPRRHVEAADEALGLVLLDGAAKPFQARARQQVVVDEAAATLDDVPALALDDGGAADLGGRPGVGVHLEREDVVGVEKLEQQREPPVAGGPGLAQQGRAQASRQLVQAAPGQRTVADDADGGGQVGQLPAFADGLARGQAAREQPLQVASAPDLRDVDRLECQRIQVHVSTVSRNRFSR